ncbi:MAG: DUF362 domain-containing protein [Desulfovibrionaceae bacterium]|nr:DUF362 domain-containing protein [Desulfovibrionaceae bacterium]
MPNSVYYWNLRSSLKAPYELRMKRLLKASGVNEHLGSGDMVAVKIHFGEQGTTGFLRPLWLRPLIAFLKKAGARPFLTDASTLYVGQRGEAVSHAMLAAAHGFDPLALGAPVIIADGIRGQHQQEVEVNGKHVRTAYIAGDIAQADLLVAVSHVKGHELAGFGGALKNVGMGCASKQGKMHQHMTTGPTVVREHCVGCGTCVRMCAAGALGLDKEKRVRLDEKLCVGCGACFLACRHNALQINWKTDVQEFLERMMEYAAAVVQTKSKPCLYLNFVIDVVPDCDCMGFTDAPVCPDLGVLASTDPVAVDQASLDLVNQAPCLYQGALPKETRPGDDKFLALRPHAPRAMGLDYAEKLGLGTRKYKLIKV